MMSDNPNGLNLVPHMFMQEYVANHRKFRANIFRERLRAAKNLYKRDLVAHFGCVNAIEFSNEGELLISAGDDRRVLLWNLEKALAGIGQPRAMEKEHKSNIFCLGFNHDNTKIFSGGNDDAVIVHDVPTGQACHVYLHLKSVYGLSIDPRNSNILATAGEDGDVILFDLRKGTEILSLGKYRGPFHAVQFHPQDGNFLVTANSKKGAGFWDMRKPQSPLFQYGGDGNVQSCMSVRFNTNGSQVLALRRRLPPILFNTFSQKPICQFYHPDYYNSCTMKSCCFAGEDDEFVLSGSDDFNLYVWHVGAVEPEQSDQWIENTQMVLYGHRSIVNQVRFNPQKCILASSGVEKIVKLWSPFKQKDWTGGLLEESIGPENPRDVFSHDAYFSLVHMNWSNMTHDYSNQNTLEDPRMMAFFDSLVQQEIEAWSSNNSSDTDQCSVRSSENSTRQSSTESSDEHFVNYLVHSRDRSRRCATNSHIKPQRTKYANRIAYLIATKRNTLRRLALKGASNSSRRRQNSLKNASKRKLHNHRAAPRTKRNGNGSKRVRFSGLSNRCRDEENTRFKSSHNSIFRSYRRKNKNLRVLDPSDSSSDNDISYITEQQKCVAASSDRQKSLYNLAVPSTSTGITANGADVAFCIPPQTVDSDDDNTPVNSDYCAAETTNQNYTEKQKVTVNGAQKKNVETQLSSDIDEDRYSNSGKCRKRRATTAADLEIYSSHSNSRLSNSSYLQDDHESSTSESSECFGKKRKLFGSNNGNVTGSNCAGNRSSISKFNINSGEKNKVKESTDVKTPNSSLKHDKLPFTPDSGICSSSSVSGCSSSNSNISQCRSSCVVNGVPNVQSSTISMKLFHQKVARVRRNYRKEFGDDSETD